MHRVRAVVEPHEALRAVKNLSLAQRGTLLAAVRGLVAHTRDEQRDLNDTRSIFGDAAEVKTDSEMSIIVQQPIDSQTTPMIRLA
jgi:hypothetical protein